MKKKTIKTLTQLAETIQANKGKDPSTSYTAKMYGRGREKIAQKLGEEAVEMIIAAVQKDKKETRAEAADVMFHYLMLLDISGLSLDDVAKELASREGISGIEEKANRATD